jgi:hypothetical protein
MIKNILPLLLILVSNYSLSNYNNDNEIEIDSNTPDFGIYSIKDESGNMVNFDILNFKNYNKNTYSKKFKTIAIKFNGNVNIKGFVLDTYEKEKKFKLEYIDFNGIQDSLYFDSTNQGVFFEESSSYYFVFSSPDGEPFYINYLEPIFY